MGKLDWAGLAIVIIALALGIGWAGTMLLVAGPATPPISDAQGQLLSAIGGGLVVIVASYLGVHRGREDSRRDRRDEEDE